MVRTAAGESDLWPFAFGGCPLQAAVATILCPPELDCQFCAPHFLGMTMPKGRPAIAGDARSKSIKVRFTPTEMVVITKRAVDLQKSISDHVRDVLLTEAESTTPAKKPAKKK